MSQKIFNTSGTRLITYVGSEPHIWELKDANSTVYFSGSAAELDQHIAEMLLEGKYSYKSKRGKKLKEIED